MKRWRCPNCRAKAGVPVRYGLPSRDVAAAAERNEVVLGGCVLTDDDPPRCCTNCRAALWPRGVFAVPGAADDMRVVLASGRTGDRRLEASVTPDWRLTIAWTGDSPRETDMVVAAVDADFLLVLLATEILDDGATLMRWLQNRGIGFVGSLDGPADRCAIASDGMVSFSGAGGDILIHSSVERLLLQLTETMYRHQGYRSIAELDGWLSAFGLEVVRSA